MVPAPPSRIQASRKEEIGDRPCLGVTEYNLNSVIHLLSE